MNEIDLRKQFLRLEQADQEALKELRSLFTDHADEIVDAFYEHLFQFEPTRKFLSQENVNQKLKAVQKQYLLSLTSGHYEQEYFDSRKRIGCAHEKVKLAPEYYLGSYALYAGLLFPLVFQKFGQNTQKLQRILLALTKILNLDMQLAMETYITAYHERLQSANQELENLNRELEQKVVERTQKLQEFEKKLRQAERLVLIGTLASEFAHEVGTPLNVILGRVEMLMEKMKSNAYAQNDLQIITGQIQHITRIIRQLLDVSKPEDVLTKTEVDLEPLCRNILEFLVPRLHKNRIQVALSLSPEAATIYADKELMEQVFLCLIINAIEAMPRPGTITIRTALDSSGHRDQIVIEIQDQGEGIPAEHLDKIFDPFFSIRQGARKTGLGLSMVQHIVWRHGGRIHVESTIGQGSTFQIRIPKDA